MKKVSTILVFVFLTTVICSQSPTPRPGVWGTNGAVFSTVIDGGYAYIAGDFKQVGTSIGHLAKLTVSSAEPNVNFPNVTGEVRAIASDGEGGWYIGGLFGYVGGFVRNNLAHIKSDGTVNADWDPDIRGGLINTIAVSGNDIYVGGDFDLVNGNVSRTRLARFSKTTSQVDAQWVPTFANESVTSLSVTANDVIVGGNFVVSNGDFLNIGLVKVNKTNGALVTTWNPQIDGLGVYALLVDGSNLYVGGAFYVANAFTPRSNLAKFNLETGIVDPSWDPNANNPVLGLVSNGTDIFIAGLFNTINGSVNRGYLVKVNKTSGAVDQSFNPNPSDGISSIYLGGNNIYAAGIFSSINGSVPVKNIARVNTTTGAVDNSWLPSPDEQIRVVSGSGNDILIGGVFSIFGGYKRNNIARINLTTGTCDPNWNPNVDGRIHTMIVVGSDIYIGGGFLNVNGSIARNRLAKISKATGTADASWNPNANSYVYKLASDGTSIYAGGTFTSLNGGTTRNRLAKLNLTTGEVDATWIPSANMNVFALEVSGSDVYIGGLFSNISGTARNYAAKLTGTSGIVDPSWNPNPDNAVWSLKAIGNHVYMGGQFFSVGGNTSAKSVARLSAVDGQVDQSWYPNLDGIPSAFVVSGSDIYMGGGFKKVNGSIPLRGIGKFSLANAVIDTTWNPKIIGSVSSISLTANELIAGGEIYAAAGKNGGGFVIFDRSLTAPPSAVTGNAASIGVRSVTLAGSVNPNGTGSKAYFEYGTTTSYGMRSDTSDVGNGTSPVPVSKNLTGLTPGTLYHYRLVGFNEHGSSNGADSMFTTLAQPLPSVTTLASDSIGIYSMRFKGTVNPQGDSTRYYFQYNIGSTVSYTDTAYAGNGTSVVTVSKYLTGLHPGRAYSVKLFAFNSAGTASGSFMSASTLPPPAPIAFTGSTNPITQTSGKMFGTINAQGDSTYWYFEYGTTTSYGMRTDTTYLGRSLTNVQVNKLITGLLPNTRYYYRIAAYNSAGLTNAGGTSFVTLNRVLTLTSPVGGEGYEPGSTTNIQWNAAAVDTIKIEYSSDNGNNWSLVVDNRVTTGGSYNWSVPSVLTTQGRIRLTSTGITPELVSDAAGVFTIASANLANSPSGTGSNLNASSFPNSGNGTAVGDSGTIVNTTNGGGSWTPPVTPMEGVTNKSLRSVSTPSIYTRITVGDSGRVFMSTNAGNNWTAVSTPTVQNYYSVAFTDTLNGSIAGGNGTILKTTNTGSTWVQQASGTTKKLFGIYLTNNQLGTVVGEDGTILYTTDGGTNWSAQSSGTTQHLNGVWFVKNAGLHQIGYVVGDSGVVLKTTNGGTAWTQLISLTSKNLNTVAFTTPERGAAAGDGGVVVYTSDGGTVWKSLVGAGSTDINNIAVPNTGGVMFMAGSSGKIFKDTAGVVPVELTSFTASSANGKITLTWITASELNNAGFDVERAESANREFAKIGEVTGKGTTTQTSEYIFTDEKAVRGKYVYRLKQRDYDGTFSYSPEVEAEVTIPMEFALSQNYPNPFNPSTQIKYQLPEAGNVLLEVYDIQGSLVRRLVNGKQEAGYYSITFEASNLPSGVYIYRLTSGRFTKTNKLMLMK